MSGGSLVAFVIFLAVLLEFLIERFFGGFASLKGYPMVLISAAAGVALCFGFHIDIIGLVGFEGAYPWWLGILLSGLIIGSGANAVHKFLKPSAK